MAIAVRVNAAARVPEVLKVGEEPSALEERLRAIIASSKDEELKDTLDHERTPAGERPEVCHTFRDVLAAGRGKKCSLCH